MTTVAVPRRAVPAVPLRAAAVLLPFLLFCAYALLRWQTMLPHMGWRPAALLVLAFAVALVASSPMWMQEHLPAAQNRAVRLTLTTAVAVVAAVLLLLIAGLPSGWVFGLRIALIARTVADGIGAVPAVTVPYLGGHREVRVMITLIGGVVVVLAALMLHGVLADDRRGDRRGRQRHLTTAAALLLVMSLMPSVVVEPHYVLLHGMIAFALTVLLIHGWRIEKGRGLGALVLLAVTAACGALIAGAVNPHHGLLTVSRIVTSLGSPKPAAFDWQQTYGPLGRSAGTEVVLQVTAPHAAHWKAEDLDVFNGVRWVTGASPLISGAPTANALVGVSKSSRKRWTQTLHVTDVDIGTDTVIAAGSAQMPLIDRTIPGVIEGAAPGTWSLASPLTPGLKYSVRVYTPDPTPAELSRTKARYPLAIRDSDLKIGLPHTAANPALTPVYSLARRLRSGTHDPYQYVEAVYRYLHHGFTYVRNPPKSADPIPTFLLHSKRGYCQQFAGSMALLLRMGGVPARVAVGFATGTYDRANRTYTVRAEDAHAWVEAWFPHYGWVTFDPTPASAQTPGTIGTGQPAGNPHAGQPIRGSKFPGKKITRGSRSTPAATSDGHASTTNPGVPAFLIVIGGVLLLIVLTMAVWALRRPESEKLSAGHLTSELESAFTRCGRPLKQEVTLAQLEGSLEHTNPDAAAYVRNVRLARFAPGAAAPTVAQRRALRAWLSRGRGVRGRLRALLALPPLR